MDSHSWQYLKVTSNQLTHFRLKIISKVKKIHRAIDSLKDWMIGIKHKNSISYHISFNIFLVNLLCVELIDNCWVDFYQHSIWENYLRSCWTSKTKVYLYNLLFFMILTRNYLLPGFILGVQTHKYNCFGHTRGLMELWNEI